MAESMIERIAEGQAGYDGRSLIAMSRHERERYYERARIALRDMREPTDAMLDAPLPASPAHGQRFESRRDLRPFIYTAMIDAALNEQVSG